MKLTFSEQFNKAQQSNLCPRFYQDLLAYGEQMRQLMKTGQFFDLQLDFLTRQIQSFKTTLSLNKVKVLQNAQALDQLQVQRFIQLIQRVYVGVLANLLFITRMQCDLAFCDKPKFSEYQPVVLRCSIELDDITHRNY